MFGWIMIGAALAGADEYYLEAAPVAERQEAAQLQQTAAAAGFTGRVVRRFRLGKGWEFVLLVEHLPDQSAAVTAAARLQRELGVDVSAWRLDAGAKAVPVDLPAQEAKPAAADGAGAWIERARLAHGGAAGGASGLARAGAVHFVYARTLALGGREVTVRHDYWREGSARRLSVDTGGGGQDSLAVATATGAWIRVGGQVQNRDIGVTIGVVDAFAPESVLTAALEAARLLEGPEVAGFRELEGAESGRRFGTGGDESEPGLSFVDIDPSTGRLLRVRYVSEAGPITFEMEGWRQVQPGVLVPAVVKVERADGRAETLRVESLELLEHAPAATFEKPS